MSEIINEVSRDLYGLDENGNKIIVRPNIDLNNIEDKTGNYNIISKANTSLSQSVSAAEDVIELKQEVSTKSNVFKNSSRGVYFNIGDNTIVERKCSGTNGLYRATAITATGTIMDYFGSCIILFGSGLGIKLALVSPTKYIPVNALTTCSLCLKVPNSSEDYEQIIIPRLLTLYDNRIYHEICTSEITEKGGVAFFQVAPTTFSEPTSSDSAYTFNFDIKMTQLGTSGGYTRYIINLG